jgi:hypothetical protein
VRECFPAHSARNHVGKIERAIRELDQVDIELLDAHLVKHQGAAPEALHRQVNPGAIQAQEAAAIMFRQLGAA